MTQGRLASEAPTRARVRRKRDSLVFWLQVLTVAAITAAVGVGLLALTMQQTQPNESPAVPGDIGGYRLTDVVRGQEAIAQLRQMHGKDIGMTAGWIGHYQQNATVWASVAANEGQAVQLLDAMERRIGAAESGPFTDLQKLNVNGLAVFTVLGQGQRHYFYRQGKLVLWLAAPKGGEDRFLKGALESLR